MVKIKREVHPLLYYTEEERIEINKEHGLTDDIIESEVHAIMEWFNKQPHLVDAGIDPDVIVALLTLAKGSREKTKRKIEAFYKGKATSPDIFGERNEFLKRNSMSWFRQISMPKLQNLERITVLQFNDVDAENFSLLDIIKNAYVVADFRLKYDCLRGDRWILDLNNISIFSILPKLNPLLLQRAANIFQDGIGQKVIGIHVLNAPPAVQSLINLLKQFFKPKIMDRVMIHETLDELYEHIGKEYLPKDYGGNNKSMIDIADMWMNAYRKEDTMKYLLEAVDRKSDEDKRPGGKTVDPLAGSFKKLDLD